MDGDFPPGGAESIFRPVEGARPRQQVPMNIQAEAALLGALLSNNRALDRCPGLKADDFAGEGLGEVYQAIVDGVVAGHVVDVVSLSARFEVSLLTELLVCMVGIVNAGDYARVIREAARARSLIEIGEALVEDARLGAEPNQIAYRATDALDEIVLDDDRYAPTFMSDAMMDAIEAGVAAREGHRVSEVATGLPTVDGLIGDMEPGDVYILAGRQSVGKSAVALQIAMHNADNGLPVDYYSTEMQARQLGRRALAMESGVSAKAQKRGQWTGAEDVKMQSAWAKFSKRRTLFNIQDCPGMNLRMIATKAKGFARKHPGKVGLIVIDHMHDLSEMHQDQMTTAVGKITSGAKTIAKTVGWPVLLLAQMNRNIDGRDEKKPEVADLYGGMQIEAIAAAIMLLHRPDRYLNPAPPEKKSGENGDLYAKRYTAWEDDWARLRGKLEMFIPKVRDGDPGYVALKFDGPSNRSTEMATHTEEGMQDYER